MGRVSGTEQFGVRKGAWTEEEDTLLRKCIEKFGEGKWRHVPMRAGLRRCRKSCRLRWLNYLKPNLKRGEFDEDEVDLIIKLHKLLGNRWSLIAGRLPGRTANDIKNHWNSHLSKRISKKRKRVESHTKSMPTATKVIKPQPRTFSTNSKWLSGNGSFTIDTQPQPIPNNATPQEEEIMTWWKSLLAEQNKEEEGKEGTWQLRSGDGGLQEVLPWSSADVEEMEKMEKEGDELAVEGGLEEVLPWSSAEVEEVEKMGKERDELMVEGGLGEWDNMLLEVDLWALLEK